MALGHADKLSGAAPHKRAYGPIKRDNGDESRTVLVLKAVLSAILAFLALLFFLLQSDQILDVVEFPLLSLVPENALEIYFIDVGQGDSMLLISPSGKTMLIDSGDENAYQTVAALLKSKGVKYLDAAVATHPHKDHIGSMAKLIGSYAPERFYMPFAAGDIPAYFDMLDALKEKGVEAEFLRAGDVIKWDDEVSVEVLSPYDGMDSGEMNDRSLVLRVSYGGTAALLTGDAELFAEEVMMLSLSDEALRAALIKIAHHGSYTSTGEKFIERVAPSVAVISVGENDYGHPHKSVLSMLEERGIAYFRTDENGTIRAVLDGEKVKLNYAKRALP